MLEDQSLGKSALELGPGAGHSTDALRHEVSTLTVLEQNRAQAEKICRRFTGTNVSVVAGSAAQLPFPDGAFDAVIAVMMMHHVSPLILQHCLLSEAWRVLQPGGVLVGVEGLAVGIKWHLVHFGDAVVAVDHHDLRSRLSSLGFANVEVHTRRSKFRFSAVRPGALAGDGNLRSAM
jgi:ubiquinone/menaquinone biosynthesis C-methylase UbiE